MGIEARRIGAQDVCFDYFWLSVNLIHQGLQNAVAARAVTGIEGGDTSLGQCGSLLPQHSSSPVFIARRRVSERPAQSSAPSALQKRPSESVLSAPFPPAKRLKQEPQETPVPKSPLAVKTNMTLEAKPSITADDAREELQDVVKKFLDTEARYERLSRKKQKTKTDATILNKVMIELDELRRRKDELKTRATVAYASPRKRIKAEASETCEFPFNPMLIRLLSLVQVVPPPMRMPLAAANSWDTNPFAPPRLALPQAGPFANSNAVAGPSRAGVNANAVAGPSCLSGQTIPLQIKQEEGLAANRERFLAAYGLKHEPAAMPSPPRSSSPPVACSSTHGMSPPLKPGELPYNRDNFDHSDDEDGDGFGYDSDALAEIQANAIINRVGLAVPPPIHDDRDEDGLYHGRGRDLYQGPRANADEYVPSSAASHFVCSSILCFTA